MKKNFKKYTFIIACLFLTLNVLADTNTVVSDYQNRLNELIEKYESQWDVLCGNVNAVDFNINDNIEKFELLDELVERMKNTEDPLENLEKFVPVFILPGATFDIFSRARAMVRNKDDDRALNLFNFLINENNPNGFSVGSSHYWVGRYLYFFEKDITNALNHFLVVHSLPSCLVFTDASYCRAAKIYNEMEKPKTALALYAIQVPHIDYWWRELEKAERSYYIAYNLKDITNAVRQIERANLALVQEPKGINSYRPHQWRLRLENSYLFANSDYATVSNFVMNNYSPYNYEIDCIREALNGEEKAKENPLLEDMLLHAWPLLAEVDSVILTNRLLSNNVFEQKRRTDID